MFLPVPRRRRPKHITNNQRGEDVLSYTPVRLIRGRGYEELGA